jgi:hypothetical protein
MGKAPTPPEPELTRAARTSPRRAVPSWANVEDVIERLSESGVGLPTSIGRHTQIASYHRGRRLMLDSGTGSRWIALDDVRECWRTFERLGSIRRQDVLEPGRCSAFMIALFAQVPGVVEEVDPDHRLVLPA